MPYVFLVTGGVYIGLQAVAIAGMFKKAEPRAAEEDIQQLGVEMQVSRGRWRYLTKYEEGSMFTRVYLGLPKIVDASYHR